MALSTAADDSDPNAVDYCPSPEEAQQHLEETGESYKPTVECNYEAAGGDRPVVSESPPPSGEEPSPPPDGSDDSLSLSEAQQRFDPEDDPHILVGKELNGEIEVIYVSYDAEAIPPDMPTPAEANVETPEDYAAYVDDLKSAGSP